MKREADIYELWSAALHQFERERGPFVAIVISAIDTMGELSPSSKEIKSTKKQLLSCLRRASRTAKSQTNGLGAGYGSYNYALELALVRSMKTKSAFMSASRHIAEHAATLGRIKDSNVDSYVPDAEVNLRCQQIGVKGVGGATYMYPFGSDWPSKEKLWSLGL